MPARDRRGASGAGELLRRHRLRAGVDQQELAGRAGLSVRALLCRLLEPDRRRPAGTVRLAPGGYLLDLDVDGLDVARGAARRGADRGRRVSGRALAETRPGLAPYRAMRRLLTVGLLLATLSACGGDPAATPSADASPSAGVENLPALREFEAPGADALARLELEPVRERGTICGPHYGFDVDSSGAAATFDPAGLKPLTDTPAGVAYPVRAPDGYEFLVAHSPGKACAANPDAPAQRAAGTLSIGGKPAQVTLPRAGGLVVLLVPKGYNASLEFKDGDQRLQLELRTGKAGGEVEDFQPGASGKFSVTGYAGRTMTVTVGFTVTARLVSFVGDRGWAPKGRCWLRVRGEYLNQDVRQVTLPSWTAQQLFAVTGPAGKVPLTGPFGDGAIASAPYTLLPHTAWTTVDAACDKGQRLKVRVTPSGAEVHLLNATSGDLVLE